jgi:hypothetical protein
MQNLLLRRATLVIHSVLNQQEDIRKKILGRKSASICTRNSRYVVAGAKMHEFSLTTNRYGCLAQTGCRFRE